ncbi:MAG: spermidine synthase [Betaproteobacteria bacterium]|nr:spermidine synthase [Betaproteobacteria bacterium]
MNFSESQGIRYLHFGTPWIQGAMRLSQPHKLVLDYTQDMMAWLMLLAAPSHLLQLGLGAGSCARFLAHYLPTTRQTIVELHHEVILANHIMFGTTSSPSITLVCDDANRFLQNTKAGYWPLIMVDLYDAKATGPACDGLDFYQHCYRALTAPGLMVLNLFGSHPSWAPNLRVLCDAFERRPLVLNPSRAGNVIGGGDWAPDRIIPDCLRAWSQKDSVRLRNPRRRLMEGSLSHPFAARQQQPARDVEERRGDGQRGNHGRRVG